MTQTSSKAPKTASRQRYQKSPGGVPRNISHEILIIGGGLAGLSTAIGLAGAGFDVAVIERSPIEDHHDEGFDGRASAIAFASCRMFEGLGLWSHVKDHAHPILDIRVSDGPSLLHLHFDHRAIGDGPLGNMLENRHIRIGLAARLREVTGITLYAPATITNTGTDENHGWADLEDGRRITGTVMLAVDGRASQTRQRAGIAVSGWGYGQVGIVCAIGHEESHAGIAHERFLPSGPFAILPLTGNRSSLVWTEQTRFADAIMGLGPRAFGHEVQKRCGEFLGKVEVLGDGGGRRWCYPLTLQFAHSYVANRLALVGDSAHGIHPIAGQGLNLGLRDAAALIDVFTDARAEGKDIGSAEILDRYAQWRRTDTAALIGVTDVLNRLFSNDIAPIRIARDLGIAAVNKIDPLKTFFMQHARGTVGDLPRLLRGELVRV